MTSHSRSNQLQEQIQQQLQSLSPQQLLVVKLLELPTVELEERVRAEILDNPALEEGKETNDSSEFAEEPMEKEYTNEDLSLGDYLTEDDIPDYKLQEHNRIQKHIPEEIPFSDNVSFYEVLKEQLDMQKLTDEEFEMADYLIGSLDDDGILRKNMNTIIDELAIYRGIYTNLDDLEKILSIIQGFDPAGIGARNLQECLLIQLKRKPSFPLKDRLIAILTKSFDDFTRKNKEKIMQRLNINEQEYEEAINEFPKKSVNGTSLTALQP